MRQRAVDVISISRLEAWWINQQIIAGRREGAALAARLRRLSERFDRDATKLYAAQNIRFEQRWYGLLNQLVLNGSDVDR